MRLFVTTSFIRRLCCLFILLGANTYGSTLLVLGDSLSAGYGVNQGSGWVALLRDDLRRQSIRSLSMAALAATPQVEGSIDYACRNYWKSSARTMCCLELGGNDGLRGQPAQPDERQFARP